MNARTPIVTIGSDGKALPSGAADSDVAVLDFNHLQHGGNQVAGTHHELIRDGHDHPVRWLHNGHAQPDDREVCFLLARGWSATLERRQRIADAGIPVMSVNNYPADGPKPRYWCSGDPPHYFPNRIWGDPDVMKFCGFGHRELPRARDGVYEPKQTPMESPNTLFFHHLNNDMDPLDWLAKPWICWGTTLFGEKTPAQFYESGAARSSLLIGLRLVWHLGYRRCVLLGCDCAPHHHPAKKYYDTIFFLLESLAPVFERFHFEVVQANPDSHLRMFDFCDFDGAIAYCEETAKEKKELHE